MIRGNAEAATPKPMPPVNTQVPASPSFDPAAAQKGVSGRRARTLAVRVQTVTIQASPELARLYIRYMCFFEIIVRPSRPSGHVPGRAGPNYCSLPAKPLKTHRCQGRKYRISDPGRTRPAQGRPSLPENERANPYFQVDPGGAGKRRPVRKCGVRRRQGSPGPA